MGIVVALGGQPASGQDGKKVVLNIGMQQGIDSMNVVRGVTVAAFEAWNMQFATLTDKSAEDFSPIPGLAESWKSSADKKTWTYKLRPDLKWSDGQPLTAEDVAYTINRSRDEAWLNHSAIVANLKAPRDLARPSSRSRPSVPDPKLPTLDAYIVPKHVYDKYDEKAITKYNGQTDVGSGPFTLAEFKKGQFARFEANPNYYGGEAGDRRGRDPRVQQRRRDGRRAARAARSTSSRTCPRRRSSSLQRGLRTSSPSRARRAASTSSRSTAATASRRAIPRSSDPKVREAIAQAIDKKTIVDRVAARAGHAGRRRQPVGEPGLDPEIPEDQRFDVRPRPREPDPRRRGLQGHRRRRRARDARRRAAAAHALRGPLGEPASRRRSAEFISGWLKEIGIATTQKTYDDGQLTELIGKGDYDIFVWGWTPYVDPDTMLSYFTCDLVASDPDDPTNYYNDANLVRPGVRQALRAAEGRARPRQAHGAWCTRC